MDRIEYRRKKLLSDREKILNYLVEYLIDTPLESVDVDYIIEKSDELRANRIRINEHALIRLRK
jgi:hypothetical protein